MLRLYGIAITDAEARDLIGTLMANGDAEALSAANVIRKALEGQLAALALSPDQRDAILSTLEDSPRAGLLYCAASCSATTSTGTESPATSSAPRNVVGYDARNGPSRSVPTTSTSHAGLWQFGQGGASSPNLGMRPCQ
jgi:hypothetical protein